jgi:hypothetical protein
MLHYFVHLHFYILVLFLCNYEYGLRVWSIFFILVAD